MARENLTKLLQVLVALAVIMTGVGLLIIMEDFWSLLCCGSGRLAGWKNSSCRKIVKCTKTTSN